jgi:hypothetical protein
MRAANPNEINDAVQRFLSISPGRGLNTTGRARSWDYCFNYFQAHPQPTRDMELSCLQLGYYLASWGMLRGSSYLFAKTNSRHYITAIDVIEQHSGALADIDASDYANEAARNNILAAYEDLRQALLPEGGTHLTLVSKVMMGVWGVIPSFDTYFLRGIRQLADTRQERSAFGSVSHKSLTLLGDFYDQHRPEIDLLARQHTTLDFATGAVTTRPTPLAKVIDMYGFQKGYSG